MPEILLEKLEDNIYELIISNPKKRNALNAQMWADLPNILNDALSKSDLKVLIVRGDGDHFASGADISEFETLYATPETSSQISDTIAASFKAIAEFPFPTIAQIRGACVGGGCGVTLCCDIRIADKSSKFAITPAKLGLVYPYPDLQRLIEAVGIPRAKDLLFTARAISAEQAREFGLIHDECPPDNLVARVLDRARMIAKLSSQSHKVTKDMFAAYQNGQFGDNAETIDWFKNGFSSADFKEGYSAFLEKRKPNF